MRRFSCGGVSGAIGGRRPSFLTWFHTWLQRNFGLFSPPNTLEERLAVSKITHVSTNTAQDEAHVHKATVVALTFPNSRPRHGRSRDQHSFRMQPSANTSTCEGAWRI